MGASQSSPNQSSLSEDSKPIRPYGLGPNGKHIQLNSSHRMLYDGIVSIVRNNKYADLVVICGNDRYPVHRAIVCPRSSFFEEHCTPREGECDYASPAKPTKIWIDPSECDSHILAAVLTFLYTLDYCPSGQQVLTFGLPEEVVDECDDSTPSLGDGPDEDELDMEGDADIQSATTTFTTPTPLPSRSSSRQSSQTTKCLADPGEPQNELVFHVKMCAAGHLFNIVSLCDVASEKLSKQLASSSGDDAMIDCIREVYMHGDTGGLAKMRESVVKMARSRFRVLKTCKGWDDLVIDFPEFAAEMLRRL